MNVTGNAAILNGQLFDYRRVNLHPTHYHKLSFRIQQKTLAMRVGIPGFYDVIVTNGINEHVTFAIHLVGEYEVLNHFPSDANYV